MEHLAITESSARERESSAISHPYLVSATALRELESNALCVDNSGLVPRRFAPPAIPPLALPVRHSLPVLMRSPASGLTVNEPGDPFEQEADRVADQVMRMASPPVTVQRKCSSCAQEEQLQRKCANCEEEENKKLQRKCDKCEEEEKNKLQRQDTGTGPRAAPDIVHEVLSSPGQPLDPATRAFMEPRFGHDFSHVRVHKDERAAQSAKAVDARAYTVGPHVVFDGQEYAPHTEAGRHLLAHELAHVTQQGTAPSSTRRLARQADDDDQAELDAVANVGSAQYQATVLRRAPAPDGGDSDPGGGGDTDGGGEHLLSRSEEIALSRTSDGEFDVSVWPPTLSLYNFAIDSAELKPAHRHLIAELGALISSLGGVPWLVIGAVGNADSTGAPAVNTPLSRRRAVAVQVELEKASGVSVTPNWHGEDNPVVDNSTVEGRSRNRRVDLIFSLLPDKVKPGQKDDGTKDDGKKDDGKKDDGKKDDGKKDDGKKDDTDWFCQRHPIICALLGLGLIAGLICWFFPTLCLPSLPGLKKGRKHKACVDDIDLPAGKLEVDPGLAHVYFKKPFKMKLLFDETNEATAAPDDDLCKPYCGEYRQNVQGFFSIVRADGTVVDKPKMLSASEKLEPDKMKEDGDVVKGPYGHRFKDAFRLIEGPNWPEDMYTPTRGQGPKYEGIDEPGIPATNPFDTLLAPGDTYFMQLDFEGGPVDTCALANAASTLAGVPMLPIGADLRLAGWQSWTVVGSYTKPVKPGPGGTGPGAGGGTAPGGGGGTVKIVPPVPFTGSANGAPPHILYIGGLGKNPTPGRYQIQAQFESNGVQCQSSFPADVISVLPEVVTIQTVDPPLNIAPVGDDPIVIIPGRKVPIRRGALIRWP